LIGKKEDGVAKQTHQRKSTKSKIKDTKSITEKILNDIIWQ